MGIGRRDFLIQVGTGALTVYLHGCSSFGRSPSADYSQSDFLTQFGPIDRTLGDSAPRGWSGDSFERPHGILWDIPGYLAQKKVEGEVEEVPLVVVGGGLSGLFSAYCLKEFRPVVLEQAPRFGGNAKGQSWRGMDYALGSAYIDLPHPGTPMRELYDSLGLEEILVPRPEADPVEANGRIYPRFWEGEREPKFRAAYERIGRFFKELNAEKERSFPLIPALTQGELDSVKYYDRWDLHELLTKRAKMPLPPYLETAIEHYCWSTYAASAKELSASAALNFLAQEDNPIRIGAGGNARIAERLVERLLGSVPSKNLRAGAIVVQVKVEDNGVSVLYEDSDRKLRKIKAKAAVMSCPKFVAKRVLVDMEPERVQAIEGLKYRSYLTANLLLSKRAKGTYYDLFLTADGKRDLANVEEAQARKNATDFVMANFADGGKKDYSVLTFYRALPYDGARTQIFQPTSYDDYRKRFETQIEKEILPLVGLSSKEVVDLRLTRWGHALPLSAKGLYSGDVIPKLRKPFRERVFFVEQDNWAYPSLQTGANEAKHFAPQIKKFLI